MYCEEEHHHAAELNAHGPTVRGWQSAKNCSYPQEIILQLQYAATVQRIQILSHQYLISEKIELWASDIITGENVEVCDPESFLGDTRFEYLGFITLSDNQSTGFKSRELKSVTVPSCRAKYLKLRLHVNHRNELNIYNQVGLIAINVLGQQLMSSSLSMKACQPEEDVESNNNGHEEKETDAIPVKNDNCNNNLSLLTSNPDYTSPYDDLAFEMYVDPEVAKIIRAMEVKKQHAVICERFEYARKLKLAMEDLRRAGERLNKYELEKRQAIHLEDYDRAKLKKAQMDQYREMVYRFLEIDDLLEINGILEKNDECVEMSSSGGKRPELPTPPQLLPVPKETQPGREGALSPNHVVPPAMHQSPVSPLHHHGLQKSPLGAQNQLQKSTPNTSPTNQQQTANCRGFQKRRNKPVGQTPARTSYEAYEERMVPALRHCHTNSTRECQTDIDVLNRSKLTEREKKQAALPISVFGIDMVERFYSKQYSDKEDGLRMLQDELRGYTSGEVLAERQHPPNKIARAAIFLLHRALRDKVYSVYSLAAETIRLFFVEFIPARVSAAEVARSVDRLLPELLSKSGDPTPRIHNMAVHTILSMADCQEVRELHIIPVHLSRALTSSIHPRLALSRLEMVEQLILNHGISTDKQSGLTCRVLAEFGSSGLHHPAEPVRKVAERILTLVYKVNPRLVRKQLPPDDDITRRNLLYRQLFHEFDHIDILRKKAVLEKNRQHQLAAQQKVTAIQNVTKSTGHQTGSSSSSASVITSPSETSQPDANEEKMCIFCLVRAESFTEEGLNVHYWRTCPMLTRCTHCKQVVEISSLSQHVLDDCDVRESYRRCDRCSEAILVDKFDEHLASVECIPAQALTTGNHCPLCHNNIQPWEDGWRQHLIVEPCPNHPRKKYLKNRSKSPSEMKDQEVSTSATKTF